MNKQLRAEDRIAVVAPEGRFDAHRAPDVQTWIKEQDAAGIHDIIIDLTAVNFVDSAALAVMVNGMKACRAGGGDLVLCGVQQPVGIILELTRLDRALRIFADVDAASTALLYEPVSLSN